MTGAPIKPGDVLVAGRYRVEKILGSGTFGWVAAAVHTQDGTRAALKILRPEQAASASSLARFVRREVQILRRIHERRQVPQVVRVLEPDVVEENGLFCLVLELIEGPSLTEVLTNEKLLDQGEARRLLRDCAVGLAAIHEADGVHRDIKPDNIRLRATGEAVLIDLGIAKALWSTEQLTKTTDKPMTPVYASPEQLAGEEVVAPTDVYSLGLVGYEMLTGAVPLSGRTITELVVNRIRGEVPDVRSFGRPVPDDMVVILRACLDRRPASRPPAAVLARALGGDANATQTIVSVTGPQFPSAPLASTPPPPVTASLVLGETVIAAPQTAQAVSRTRSPDRSGSLWPVLLVLFVLGAGAVSAVLVFRSHARTRPMASSDPADTGSGTNIQAPLASVSVATTSAKAVEPPMPTLRIELVEDQIRVGKPLVARLEATAPLHVLLLDVYEAGDGIVASPSILKRDLVVAPGEGAWFPPDKVDMTASLLPGQTQTHESFHAFGLPTVADVEALVPKAAYTAKQTPLTKADIARIEEAARKAGAVEASAGYVIRR